MSGKHFKSGLLARLQARHGPSLGSNLVSAADQDTRDTGSQDRAGSDSDELWNTDDEIVGDMDPSVGPSTSRDVMSDSDIVPDTPSPVYPKKFRKAHKTTGAARSKVPPAQTTEAVSNENPRASALNKLRKKRLRYYGKKTDPEPSENESNHSDDDYKLELISSSDEEENLPRGLRENVDDSLPTTTSEMNEESGSTTDGEATSRVSGTDADENPSVQIVNSDSDSTDIDEDDLEDFINKMLSGPQGRGRTTHAEVCSEESNNHDNINPQGHLSKRKSRSPKSPDDVSNKRSRTYRENSEDDGEGCPEEDDDLTGAVEVVNCKSRSSSRVSSEDSVVLLDDFQTPAASSRKNPENDPQGPSTSRAQMTRKATKKPTAQTPQENDCYPSTSSQAHQSTSHTSTHFSTASSTFVPASTLLDTNPMIENPRTSEQGPSGTTPYTRRRPNRLTSTPLTVAGAQASAPAASEFLMPTVLVSPLRDGRTSTQTRVPGLRRRGNRSRVVGAVGSTPSGSGLVSPQTRAQNQLAEDELMARRLQEEMDRELASMLEAGSSARPPRVSPPALHMRHGHTAAEGPRQGGRSAAARRLEESLDRDVQYYMMLGAMTDEEFEQYQAARNADDSRPEQDLALATGLAPTRPAPERNAAPPAATRRNTRSHTRSHMQPTGSGVRARGVQDAMDYDGGSMMRPPFGGMSRENWSLHQAILNNRDPDDSLQSALDTVLDPELLNFLAHRDTRHRHAAQTGVRGRQRGRRSRPRGNFDLGANSFTANDYEDLLSLVDTLGEVKSRGLTNEQINMLPTKPYRAAEVRDDVKECNICFAEYEEGDTLRLLQCFHSFHGACIDRWLKENASCPICRVEVKFE